MQALGRARQAKGRQHYDADVNMPAFLTAKNLKPFVSKELEVTSSQIEFQREKGGMAYGYPAEILPKVCDVFLDADESGALAHNQKHIAAKAKMLMRGLAHVGIVALIDEATGYQEVRDRMALQAILDAYLRKELAAWAKRFPDEFYQQMFRLRGWQWQGMSVNRPQIVGKYTNDIVYERLAPGILEELQETSSWRTSRKASPMANRRCRPSGSCPASPCRNRIYAGIG
jgi:P63C domain